MNIERFKEIIRYSKANKSEIESKVKDFYVYAGMHSEEMLLNLMQIARPIFDKKDYIIVEMPFADKEIGALCYKGDCVGYTFLNTSLPKVNVNFALCHEIYHVFYQDTQFKQKVELLSEHYYEYEEEFAANLFAGMLLMPEQSFKTMFYKFCNERTENESDVSILVKLMSYFEVPYMAVLIRCYELDLLDSGSVLERLIKVDNSTIRNEFKAFWLDEKILNASKKDDYEMFEEFVRTVGKQYQEEELVNERMVNKVIHNMRLLYNTIKGE